MNLTSRYHKALLQLCSALFVKLLLSSFHVLVCLLLYCVYMLDAGMWHGMPVVIQEQLCPRYRVLGIELGSPGLCGKLLYPLTHGGTLLAHLLGLLSKTNKNPIYFTRELRQLYFFCHSPQISLFLSPSPHLSPSPFLSVPDSLPLLTRL